MFYVGQKVVCVDDAGFCAKRGEATPKRGSIYTVRGFTSYPGLGELILVDEIRNPVIDYIDVKSHECGWRSRRFRPAVERKTSIEIFTRMLNPSKERETVT